MSDDKGFLSRWSQRKQQATQPELKPDELAAEADRPPQPVAQAEPEPVFDPSSLPRLEEMTATTDITGFLRKGVPEQLRNAALRQSWALDPAIRNYVNPALEYAYDWNTPGGVPGSSEIGTGIDVARMVAQIMGPDPSINEASEPASGSAPQRIDAAAVSEAEIAEDAARVPPSEAVRRVEEVLSPAQNPGIELAQADDVDPAHAASRQPVRRHGSAKPID